MSTGFTFRPEAVEKIINSLEDDVTHTIESFQLQMVCRYAEDLIVLGQTKTKNEIAEQDLGNIQSIFAENYRKILNELSPQNQYAAQVLIEENLIVGGNRVPLPEIVILQQLGIPQIVINKLLDSHFLRAEVNSTGGRSIELSHDTLIAPITEFFEKRKAEQIIRLEKEQAEIALTKQQQELEIAKGQAETERKRAEEQSLLRTEAEIAKSRASRNLMYAGVIAVIAIIVATIAILYYRESQKAIESANVERAIADKAFKMADSAYKEVKKEQAQSKAKELKDFGDSYRDMDQLEFAKQNYQAAFDSIKAYPDLPIYQDLKLKARK